MSKIWHGKIPLVSALNNIIFAESDAKRIIVQPEKENHASCNTLLAAGYVYDEENELYIVTKHDFQNKNE